MTLPRIISIEGNIGAGKSTLLAELQKYYTNNKEVVFLREPVDIWESVRDPADGQNILQKFYGNPATYAFPFQVMAYITRLSLLEKTIKENPQCSVVICERSLCADRNIFAKMLFDDGLIDNVCYQIYMRIYDEFSCRFPITGIVYVDAGSDTCFRRIAKRARDGEGGIALDYLQKCKKYHDEWLVDSKLHMLHLRTDQDATYGKGDIGYEWVLAAAKFIA